MQGTANLNVTYNGESHTLPSLVYTDSTDDDIRRIASESLNSSEDFAYYVVDRFPDTGMIYLRPKVPFGNGEPVVGFVASKCSQCGEAGKGFPPQLVHVGLGPAPGMPCPEGLEGLLCH